MQRAITQPRFSSILVIAALTAAAGCRDRNGHDDSMPPAADAIGYSQPLETESRTVRGEPPMAVESQVSVTEGDVPQWRITAVVIDVGLADLCGIDRAEANFDYDSARLDADAKRTIAALADCFVDGALAGRDAVVIGHADPRGPDDYNRELGMSRADAVAQELTRHGLPTTRIDVESHGEAHAHADPSEWPDDRRVDVQIAD